MKQETPKNIEVFNHIVLYTLVKLYDSFPIPIDLDSDSIGLDARPDENDKHELWKSMEVSEHTLTWLQQEGFITVESRPLVGHLQYSGVRLTLKGFTLLGYTPDSISDKKDKDTLIKRAKDVVSKAIEQSATDVVGKLFLAALHYIPKAMG